MRVCLICSQIADWGKIGGFGTATRALGGGLVRNGVEVVAVVPLRSAGGQRPIEILDGMTVHGIGPGETLTSGRVFREVDADLYHSQEPTVPSWWAQRTMPDRVHVVTCRDPRSWNDHLVELWYSNIQRRLLAPVSLLYEASPWVKAAVRRADAVLTPAPSALNSRILRLYGADIHPRFMPYPVEIPGAPVDKENVPHVLFVGRFDRRKRVEIFFDLARRFPCVQFTAVGAAHDKHYDRRLRREARTITNLHLPGFVPRFGQPSVSRYYARAWILVNVAAREGLPYTFMEAAAYSNAILSGVDPEGFASRFGYHVTDDDYAAGLRWLLEGDRWREKGQAGAAFVAKIWNEEASVKRHLQLYQDLTSDKVAKHGVSRRAFQNAASMGAPDRL